MTSRASATCCNSCGSFSGRRRRARIVLRVQPPLQRLAERLPGVDAVVTPGQVLPPHDRRCAICSLAFVLGVSASTLLPSPCLTVDPALAQSRHRHLGARPGLKVGIAWQGNPSFKFDTQRSLPPKAFRAWSAIPGIAWVSLQKDEPAASFAPGLPILDLAGRLIDMIDTAALISALDLVIAVDSSRIHLAGALGARAWLLNRFAADWRWHVGRDDSDWYPGVRQFRQSRPADWTTVIERVGAALAALVAG
jgi:hypothetical protein